MNIFIFNTNRLLLASLFLIVSFLLYNLYFLWLGIIGVVFSIIVNFLNIYYLDPKILRAFAWTVWVWWIIMTFYNKNKKKTITKKDLIWSFSIVQKQNDQLIVHMHWKKYKIKNSKWIQQGDMIKIKSIKNNSIKVKKAL